MFIETLVLAVIIGLVLGGRFGNLKNLSLRHIELFILAFAVQAGLNYCTAQEVSLVVKFKGYIHLLSYALLFAGLFMNRSIPGIKTLSLGISLNFLVIAANQGLMPVLPTYLPEPLTASLSAGKSGIHGLITETTRLRYLADIIYCPLPYQNQMLSVGDVVIDIGAFYLVVKAMKSGAGYYKIGVIDRKL